MSNPFRPFRTRRLPFLAAGLLATLLAPAAARAADEFTLFPKGTNALTFAGGYDHPITNDEEQFTFGSFGYGYYFLNNLAIVPQLRGWWVKNDDHSDTVGGDFDLGFRYHFFTHDNWTLFAGIAGGLSYFSHEVPQGTTHFNFMAEGSLGATYRLQDNLHLFGGINITHFSNGGIQGSDRHDGSNALGGFIGLLWTF